MHGARLGLQPAATDRDASDLDVRCLLADADQAEVRIGLRCRSGASDEIITERVTSLSIEGHRTARAGSDPPPRTVSWLGTSTPPAMSRAPGRSFEPADST